MPRSRSRSYDRMRRRSKSRSREYGRRSVRQHDSVRDDYRYRKKDRSYSRERDRSHRDRDKEKRRHDDYSRKKHRSRSHSKGHSRSSHSHSKSRDNRKHEESKSKTVSAQPQSKSPVEEVPKPSETESKNQGSTSLSFETIDELYRNSFQSFSNENKMILTNIESEEDRIAIQEKMQEHLKRHFAAQGKVYPPVKPEKPLINEATGFANDGSFLEQFKKMQNDYKEKLEQEERKKRNEERLKNLPARRRGGKILKTGIVAKNKSNEDNQDAPVDAWSLYLKEVQKYKNASCDADSKTRPLVK